MKLNPLDILFSEYIRKRAILRTGGCERCLTLKQDIVKDSGEVFPAWKQLQCSHFWGRARHSVRYDEDNAAGLCGACHIWLSANPQEHLEFFKQKLGEQAFELLRGRAYIIGKPDINAITLYLKEQIRHLTQ